MIRSKEQATPENLNEEMKDLAYRLRLNDINEALYFPKFFMVETTRVCNARCPFCPVEEWGNGVNYMPDSTFDIVAQQLIEEKDWVHYVCMQRAGEPLLDMKLAKRIKRLKQGGIKRIDFSTNASMLTEDRAVELFKAGLDEIMCSIDSVEKEEYEKSRIGLKYDKVMNNIKTLFKVRDRINPKALIRVRGVLCHDPYSPEGKAAVEKFEAYWAPYRKPQDRVYMKKLHNWANQHKWEGHIPDHYSDIFHPCILPWSTFMVNTDGKVPLCGLDYNAGVCYGNILEKSIKDIWRNSPKLQETRRLHSTGNRNEISFCRGCRLFDKELSLEKNSPVHLPQESTVNPMSLVE
jgi:radical SAM protein with 4Fe4S-binding SPASM domain